MRVSAVGGSPESFASPDASKGDRSYRWPEILPGGKAVVYVIAEAKDVGFFTQSNGKSPWLAAARPSGREMGESFFT